MVTKIQITRNKNQIKLKLENSNKKYDLEGRTALFAEGSEISV